MKVVHPFFRRSVVAGAVLALLASCALAETPQTPQTPQEPQDPHTVQPERPTVATHAGTVAPGWVEIETGVELDHLHTARALTTPTTVKIGLARRLQLSLVESFVRTSGNVPPRSGLGDAALGIKWRLAEDLPVLGDFAVLPSIKLPTGSARRRTGTGTTDADVLLISSHQIGAASVDVNVGYLHRSGDGSDAPRNATLWTVSGGVPVAGALGWAGEVYGLPATSGPSGQRSIVALLTGPTLQIRRWLAVDAGVIVPLAGPQPHAVYAGLVWNIGQLY
ncbi:MAG TPA: transporter [Thermoanaerobaculia bacterium]|nr:transporter [Thermoanaerobaculia bacterium]